jgi:hypothetical protein
MNGFRQETTFEFCWKNGGWAIKLKITETQEKSKWEYTKISRYLRLEQGKLEVQDAGNTLNTEFKRDGTRRKTRPNQFEHFEFKTLIYFSVINCTLKMASLILTV